MDPEYQSYGSLCSKGKGYFKDAGLDVDIKLPPEDSSSDLIINGKAPFGIYFQDSMAKKLDKGAGITAVAAIVEHNTSGIISRKDAAITSPKDLVGKKYGTWNDPIELEMIKSMMKKEGADFNQVKLVPIVIQIPLLRLKIRSLMLLGFITVGMEFWLSKRE